MKKFGMEYGRNYGGILPAAVSSEPNCETCRAFCGTFRESNSFNDSGKLLQADCTSELSYKAKLTFVLALQNSPLSVYVSQSKEIQIMKGG